jgi:putative Mg2+ transporter-C (MgtC) family protein
MMNWQETWTDFLHLGFAFLLTAVIGWNREQEEHNVGIRAFPIVGLASCAYLLIASSTSDAASQSRVLQGLITGIGFIGGGAILKEGVSIKGTATAASVWSAGAIGASVAMNRFGIAAILTLLNLFALRGLLPLKNRLDRAETHSRKPKQNRMG